MVNLPCDKGPQFRLVYAIQPDGLHRAFQGNEAPLQVGMGAGLRGEAECQFQRRHDRDA